MNLDTLLHETYFAITHLHYVLSLDKFIKCSHAIMSVVRESETTE